MTGIPTGLTFPGIEDISAFEYVCGRGIEPGQCIIECLPQELMTNAAGDLVITYDENDYTVPDMAPVEQWLKQQDGVSGFRMCVRLLDHRRRWRGGAIAGRYNVRLADGTVYTPTKKEPFELATLCLEAMGETGYDVSRMPTGVYPPILWDNCNPAQALDHLCRYVACEITGGERGAVVIWPTGTGGDLPDDGEYINPPYPMPTTNAPITLLLMGGKIIFQAKLLLKGHVIQTNVATTLTPVVAADTNWPRESPWSLPGIAATETRQDAFESEFRQFPVVSLADGANTLPFVAFPITAPHQFILQNYRLDVFTSLSLGTESLPPRVEGKFFPYADDADSHTTIKPFTGRFLIRQDGNIVEFPYPVWKTSTTGEMEEPDLYLLTAFYLQKVDRDGICVFTASRLIGGPNAPKVLQRPELFFGVKYLYAANGITIIDALHTLDPCNAEAQRYLDIFTASFTNQIMLDREWLEIRDIALNGKIAQVRYKGSVRDNDGGFTTRASQNFEFDIHGPTLTDGQVRRDVTSKLERSCP